LYISRRENLKERKEERKKERKNERKKELEADDGGKKQNLLVSKLKGFLFLSQYSTFFHLSSRFF